MGDLQDRLSELEGSNKERNLDYVGDLKIDSESFTSSIGDNKSATLDFSCQIGGPEQKNVGVFMSGWHNVDAL